MTTLTPFSTASSPLNRMPVVGGWGNEGCTFTKALLPPTVAAGLTHVEKKLHS